MRNAQIKSKGRKELWATHRDRPFHGLDLAFPDREHVGVRFKLGLVLQRDTRLQLLRPVELEAHPMAKARRIQ